MSVVSSATRVLVMSSDRALRASLTYLLKLEPDLDVRDCSAREVADVVQDFRPDVLLAGGAPESWEVVGATCRVIPLNGMTPYDLLLHEVRSGSAQAG